MMCLKHGADGKIAYCWKYPSWQTGLRSFIKTRYI